MKNISKLSLVAFLATTLSLSAGAQELDGEAIFLNFQQNPLEQECQISLSAKIMPENSEPASEQAQPLEPLAQQDCSQNQMTQTYDI